MSLRATQTELSSKPNTTNFIILFPDNDHLQSIIEQYSDDLEKSKNNHQHHFSMSDTQLKEAKTLKRLEISDKTLQIFTDKMSEITQKISTLNKNIPSQNQFITKSNKMLEATKDKYMESLINNDKEYIDSIESNLKKYQYNLDVAQAKILSTQKAIKCLKVCTETLKKLINYIQNQLLKKEFLSIKKEYLQHLNIFKKQYHAYRKILESDKFRYRFENKGDTDSEMYNTLDLDIYAPKRRKY